MSAFLRRLAARIWPCGRCEAECARTGQDYLACYMETHGGKK